MHIARACFWPRPAPTDPFTNRTSSTIAPQLLVAARPPPRRKSARRRFRELLPSHQPAAPLAALGPGQSTTRHHVHPLNEQTQSQEPLRFQGRRPRGLPREAQRAVRRQQPPPERRRLQLRRHRVEASETQQYDGRRRAGRSRTEEDDDAPADEARRAFRKGRQGAPRPRGADARRVARRVGRLRGPVARVPAAAAQLARRRGRRGVQGRGACPEGAAAAGLVGASARIHPDGRPLVGAARESRTAAHRRPARPAPPQRERAARRHRAGAGARAGAGRTTKGRLAAAAAAATDDDVVAAAPAAGAAHGAAAPALHVRRGRQGRRGLLERLRHGVQEAVRGGELHWGGLRRAGAGAPKTAPM